MCGILGGLNTEFSAEHVDRLRHRGPDQSSFDSLRLGEADHVELGQCRLNIVDRADVTLPVRHGPAAILFNGELYNHPELRRELADLGWRFTTRTDTEVALVAYLQWGPSCLERFNGMFALVVWDGRRFFCARDRLGQKPLYCRHGANRFEFASEIKAFDDLQLVQQDTFDLFEFTFDDRTIYRDVFAVRPGHYLIYDTSSKTWWTRRYWDISHQAGDRMTDPKQAVDRFIELLGDAVALRMRADVDVSMFLSGGIDSTLVACLSGVKEVFTCQFDDFKTIVNEQRYVQDTARRLGLTVHVVRPTREAFFADLARMSYHLEIPTGSFSVFPLYRLAAAAHDRGFKVVLTGEGADELFAGYVRNEYLISSDRPQSEKTRHYAAMIGRFDGAPLDRFSRMASRSGLAGAAIMKAYLTHLWDDRRSPLENICFIESCVFLQPLLQMSDRMCMAHSVEPRCPFLDHRLVEFSFSLDDSLRCRDGVGKWIVTEAARRLLPAGSAVLTRTIKDGLPAPINLWITGQHSFDRRYWNALMTAECVKTLLNRPGARCRSPLPEPPDVRRLLSDVADGAEAGGGRRSRAQSRQASLTEAPA